MLETSGSLKYRWLSRWVCYQMLLMAYDLLWHEIWSETQVISWAFYKL